MPIVKYDEMNVLGLSVLQDIKKFKGFEEAIIGGGFVRDHIMRGTFSDIDIFVPVTSQDQITKIISKINQPFDKCNYTPFNRYSALVSPVFKYDTKYMGIDVDIVFEIYDDKTRIRNPSFGDYVVSRFSYGIDMTWYDGDIHYSKEFNYDYHNHTATLLMLEHIRMLPAAINKFNRLNDKYPGWNFHFACPLLTLNKENKKEEVKKETVAKYFTGSSAVQWYNEPVNNINILEQARLEQLNREWLAERMRPQPVEPQPAEGAWRIVDDVEQLFLNGRWQNL